MWSKSIKPAIATQNFCQNKEQNLLRGIKLLQTFLCTAQFDYFLVNTFSNHYISLTDSIKPMMYVKIKTNKQTNVCMYIILFVFVVHRCYFTGMPSLILRHLPPKGRNVQGMDRIALIFIFARLIDLDNTINFCYHR